MPSRTISPALLSALLFALLALARPLPARAQSADAPTPAPAVAPPEGSWAAQLASLSQWLGQRQGPASCTEHCFVLDRLHLAGSVADGALAFELEGAALADGVVRVPLFGPPDHVRLEGVTENGRPAVVGFEGDAYYLVPSSRRFVLRGTLVLGGERSLQIPGPLNALEADVTQGALLEGSRLSGLAGTTIHFESGDGTARERAAAQPAVFQLARAVRVAREVTFEYRLTLQSGGELGVVRLPLPYGERVLNADGAAGWRVEDGELVLSLAGRSAQVTVTGTLPRVGRFEPDARSSYEWWLFESDAEHRLAAEGDARPHDAGESPVARTQPTARLFLVQRGQHVDLSVQTLVAADVLAAVVRSDRRTTVLTARGDLVSDEMLAYENTGIDYLFYSPDGRPVYLASDGASERIMRREGHGDEVLIPLRTGSHAARVQTLSQYDRGLFGGRLAVPAPSYPLAASGVALTVGLPRAVHPVLATGGDCTEWYLLGKRDLAALAIAALAACLALRTRARRVLGTVALAGLWFLSPPLYISALAALAAAGVLWLLSRFLRGAPLVASGVLLAGFALLVSAASVMLGQSASARFVPPAADGTVDDVTVHDVTVDARANRGEPWDNNNNAIGLNFRSAEGGRYGALGNFAAQQAAVAGTLEGVTPVALTLPAYDHAVHFRRELVTRQRPFRPVLWYVTDGALAPLWLAWLACTAALLRLHRPEFARLRAALRERLARRPAAPSPTAS